MFLCPNEGCTRKELSGSGMYKTVRKVCEVTGFYLAATEYLQCSRCKRKFSAWSGPLLNQLDIGHRTQFPALLTYRYACDVSVVVLLRQRGLGNSALQMQRKLEESQGEAYLSRCLQYATECKAFTVAARAGLVGNINFKPPPPQIPVPKFGWLQTVYCIDVYRRIDEVKAAITSTLGRVLKMDSTKKVAKKLAGLAKGTAAWATNVGNEFGQVLISVFTDAEGQGLERMVEGIVSRYQTARAVPPEVLYVDRGCCHDNQLKRMFGAWPDLQVRLDVWHFMRRIASCCTSDAHQLYATFMGRLALCIFKISKEDQDLLIHAKRSELQAHGFEDPTDEDVFRRLSTGD